MNTFELYAFWDDFTVIIEKEVKCWGPAETCSQSIARSSPSVSWAACFTWNCFLSFLVASVNWLRVGTHRSSPIFAFSIANLFFSACFSVESEIIIDLTESYLARDRVAMIDPKTVDWLTVDFLTHIDVTDYCWPGRLFWWLRDVVGGFCVRLVLLCLAILYFWWCGLIIIFADHLFDQWVFRVHFGFQFCSLLLVARSD